MGYRCRALKSYTRRWRKREKSSLGESSHPSCGGSSRRQAMFLLRQGKDEEHGGRRKTGESKAEVYSATWAAFQVLEEAIAEEMPKTED